MIKEYWQGKVTLRQLRVLIQGLPADSRVYWKQTDGVPFDLTAQLLWRILWASSVDAAKGLKRGTDIFKDMPVYPWKKNQTNRYGGIGDQDPNAALDYLEHLTM